MKKKSDKTDQIIIIPIISHDPYLQRLINSFMHRKFAGETAQPIM